MSWSDPAMQTDAIITLAIFFGAMLVFAVSGWLVERILGVKR